jgi:hypothetical protein
MFMDNRRGWMRILEATIAVLIITGALGVVYSKQFVQADSGKEEYISSLQEKVLLDITYNKTLRGYVLDPTEDSIAGLVFLVNPTIPSNYNFTILSCDFNVACKLSPEVYILTIGKTVFVEDALVSTDIISVYNPRRVRLFIWEND